jgi:DNA-binding transcriptional ArsR family regulator
MSQTRHRVGAETRLMKALSHPLRYRILLKLNERAASPSSLADELGEPLGNVSYHVKILVEHEAIELVDTRPVRGALEHIYRATARPHLDDEHWSKLPVSVREQFHDANLEQIWQHTVEAADGGGFQAPETHVSWTELELDRQGYSEVVDLLAKTLERALEIQAESAERAAAPDAVQTELAILHYHRPREEEDRAESGP